MKNKNKIRPSSSKQIKKQVRLEKWEDDIENKKNNNQRKSLPNVHNEYNKSFNNKKNNAMNEKYLIKEQLNLLNIIWDKLGITREYKNIFINNISNIIESEQKNFIKEEKNNMKKIMDSLIETKQEIINRDNNISLLKKYNQSLENSLGTEYIVNNILKETISLIKKLRNNAVIIVRKMIKLNKVINKYVNSGKIDINKIKKDFLYTPNYLNKMKIDLLFLQNSALSKYIEMNNSDIDQFLTNCAPNPNKINNNKKITVPISESCNKLIKESKYLLLQESAVNNPKNEIEINNYIDIKNNNRYNNNYEKYLNNKNKSAKGGSVKKMKNSNIFIGDLYMSKQINELKNLYGKNFNNLLGYQKKNYISGVNNFKIRINKNKNKNKNKNIFDKVTLNNFIDKKIKIEREEVVPLTNNEFMNNLNELQTDYNFLNKTYDNKTKPIIKENIPKRKNNNNKNYEEEIRMIKDLLNKEEQKRIDVEKENDILQMKIKEISERAKEYQDELQKMNKKRKITENELNNKIIKLEKQNEELKQKSEGKSQNDNKYNENDYIQKIKILEEKLKNEESLRKKREKEIEDMKIKIKNIGKTQIEPENKEPHDKSVSTYKVDYYRGNISNLIYLISEIIKLENIPDCIKRAFLINDSIFYEEYYFKGIFPKIIISKDDKDENNIKGLCSLYYESDENLSKNSILRLYTIYAIEDWENQIINMVNFIKDNMIYKRIEVYLLYDKIDDKYIPNQEAKNLFQKKLGFKWLCVVKDEKQQQRYIKLYYSKEFESEQNKESDNDKEKENNSFNQNCNNFNLDALTIITVNNEENTEVLKNIIKEDINSELYKYNFNKYINPIPIYTLLYQNVKINNEYVDLSKKKELKEIKDNLWRFVIAENEWNAVEEEKKKITELFFNIDNSLYKEIEKYYNTKNIFCLCDLYKSNLSINFENNYSILIDDIYYNKISTNKIKILKETKTNSLFFLIPSNDNTVLFYISIVNKKLKQLLIDNDQNIYEKFLEFQPSTQKEIIEFSISSSRDIVHIPQFIKSVSKTIYIPTFSINTHLFSYNFKDINKNVTLSDMETGDPLYVTSVDEYINILFKPDDNIENSFSIVPIEDNKTNIIIKSSFIIGIFDNDIINNNKLPLLQFLYVTEDHFFTKEKYKPGYNNTL